MAFDPSDDAHLPGLIGIEFDTLEPELVRAHLPLRQALMAPNGYLHAGTVVALADTTCGYGCMLSLPESGTGFTTLELKTNFLRSAKEGTIRSRRGRIIRMSCKPRSPVGLVKSPAQIKCD